MNKQARTVSVRIKYIDQVGPGGLSSPSQPVIQVPVLSVAHDGGNGVTLYDLDGQTLDASPAVEPGFPGGAVDCSVSFDNKFLAITDGSQVDLYKNDDGLFYQLPDPVAESLTGVKAIKFDQQGGHLAVGHASGVNVYSVDGGVPALLHELTELSDVDGLEWQDGDLIAASSQTAPYAVFYKDFEPDGSPEFFTDPVTSVSAAPLDAGGTLYAASGGLQQLYPPVYVVEKGEQIDGSGFSQTPSDIDHHKDLGYFVVAVNADGLVAKKGLGDGAVTDLDITGDTPGGNANTVRFSGTGDLLAVGDILNTYLYERDGDSYANIDSVVTSGTEALAFNTNGDLLASAEFFDGPPTLFDVSGGELVDTDADIQGVSGRTFYVLFVNGFLLCCHAGGLVVYDPETDQSTQELTGIGQCFAAAAATERDFIVLTDGAPHVRYYKISDSGVLSELEGPDFSILNIQNESNALCRGDTDRGIVVIEASAGQPGDPYVLVYTGDRFEYNGRLFAEGDNQNTFSISGGVALNVTDDPENDNAVSLYPVAFHRQILKGPQPLPFNEVVTDVTSLYIGEDFAVINPTFTDGLDFYLPNEDGLYSKDETYLSDREVTGFSVHPSGEYIAIRSDEDLKVFKVQDGVLGDEITVPEQHTEDSFNGAVAWSKTGEFLASGQMADWENPGLRIHKFNVSTETLEYMGDAPGFESQTESEAVAWSDDDHLAVANSNDSFDSVFIYKVEENGINRIENVSGLPDTTSRVTFRPGGDQLAVGLNEYPYIGVFNFDGSDLTPITGSLDSNISQNMFTSESTASYTEDGRYMVVANSMRPCIDFYRVGPDAYDLLKTPVSVSGDGDPAYIKGGSIYIPASSSTGASLEPLYLYSIGEAADAPVNADKVAASPTGDQVAVALDDASPLQVYQVDDTTLTKLPDLPELPTDPGRAVAYSQDGTMLVSAHGTGEAIDLAAYTVDGTTYDRLPDVQIDDVGPVNSLEFSGVS